MQMSYTYSSTLQDPRIAEHLPEILQVKAEESIHYFACNGTCEDDWPKVAFSNINIRMHRV